MAYRHVRMPERGQRIRVQAGAREVPDEPIVGYVEGDGIGRDITRACLPVWDEAVNKAYGGRRRLQWCELYLGEKAAERYDGDYFPGETLEAIKALGVAIKGPLTTPVGEGFRSLNVALRQTLDLYACVRPVRYYHGVPSPMRAPQRVDVVIFRENTEDVYAGIEYQAGSAENRRLAAFLREQLGAKFFDGAGLGVKPISPYASKRLVRKAIQYAIDHGRESVTLVHKGNIMKYTEGSFRTWGYEVAREEFPDRTLTEDELYALHGGKVPEGKIVIKDRIADIMFQLMLLRPEEFDVIATPNLNGDYLSDAIAAQVGGIGIAPGANLGDDVAVFEATHGTAPKYADQDKVNPGSLLLSGVEMLDHLGWEEAADLIRSAYESVVQDKIVTYDFARQMEGAREVGTQAFAEAIIDRIRQGIDLEAMRAARQRVLERERRERERRRVRAPVEEMLASGRKPTTVGHIMSRALVTCSGDSSVETAMRTMRERGVTSILVEPDGDGDWGIMTRHDVLEHIVQANRNFADVLVRDIASKPLIIIDSDAGLADCVNLMMHHNIRRLGVERDGQLIGIATEGDLADSVEQFGWIRAE